MHMGPSYRNESRLRVAFVLGTSAFLALAVVLYIAGYAHNVPYYDGWVMVDVLSGAQPVDAAWLWQPRNDHRIPIPKLVLLALTTSVAGTSASGCMPTRCCSRGWPGQGPCCREPAGTVELCGCVSSRDAAELGALREPAVVLAGDAGDPRGHRPRPSVDHCSLRYAAHGVGEHLLRRGRGCAAAVRRAGTGIRAGFRALAGRGRTGKAGGPVQQPVGEMR